MIETLFPGAGGSSEHAPLVVHCPIAFFDRVRPKKVIMLTAEGLRTIGTLFLCALLLGCLSSRTTKIPPAQEICNEEADRLLAAGEWQKTIEQHQEIIRRAPDSALAHYHLGIAYGEIEQYGQEVQEYQKAIALGLQKADLYYNLGIALGEDFHDYPGAIAAFTHAVRLAPNDADFHYNLGFAYLLNNEQGRAERELQEALRLDPTNLPARTSLGSLYANQKEYQKAIDQWKEVLRLDPSNAEAIANLKWLERQGEHHDAK
jgi:tetratricopeptide (TPR) repeat protein